VFWGGTYGSPWEAEEGGGVGSALLPESPPQATRPKVVTARAEPRRICLKFMSIPLVFISLENTQKKAKTNTLIS
jgi:hypothetical protein